MSTRYRNLPRLLKPALGVMALVGASTFAQAQDYAAEVQGLWNYTGLTASTGQEMPLTGVFLMTDGQFIQQSVFNGEPFAEQGAMAHSGTFSAIDGGIHLMAGQTLSINPAGDEPLKNAGKTEHDLSVTRDGNELTIVFGSGTEQTFEQLGTAGDAKVYALDKGLMAFVDDYFVLVTGDGESAVTGYGKYQLEGSSLQIDVIRWSEGADGVAQHLRDVTLMARFDGESLSFADGRRFEIVK